MILALLLAAQVALEDRVRHLESLHGINVCGNGVLERDFAETCDGVELGGKTCQSQGHDAGVLACSPACQFDTSGCENAPPPPPASLADSVWTPIPGSEMNRIYDPAIEGVVVGARHSFVAVQDAWSGGVCVGDELFLLGGGHGDGANNAVYMVNVKTGSWRRAGPNPTTSVYYNVKSQTNPDGSLAARHSYDFMVTDGQAIYLSGGAVWNEGQPPGDIVPSTPPPSGVERSSWRFDLATEAWSNFAPPSRAATHGAMEIAGGKLYVIGAQGAHTYDFATDSWVGHRVGNDYHAGTVLVHSPDSGRLYGLGNTFSWYRTEAQFGTAERTDVPYEPVALGRYWGNTYYPPERRVLLWNGGPSILSYSELTESWSTITPSGDPGPGLKNGALGRFSYCDGRVVLVNGVDRPLYYLAVPDAPPPPPPVCGNGKREGEEECDDGNLVDDDGCSAQCQVELPPPPLVCGDGRREGEEECDDGNTLNGDGCSAQCRTEVPPDPPPQSGANPYFAVPPGDSIVVRDCGSPSDVWPIKDIRTDEDMATLRGWSPGKTARVRIHWKETPYTVGAYVKGAKCLDVGGVLGPNGERPLVPAVNGTRSFTTGQTIRPGGLIVHDLQISPGLIQTLTGVTLNIDSGVGIPGDQTFAIMRDLEISRVGHHAFINPSSSKHLYIEVGRSEMFMASSHLAYIDRVALAWVYDSKFHSPGWGHALRCIARRCVIENIEVSNVGLDGNVEPNDNPLSANSAYIGMHPFDLYSCGEHDVKNAKITIYAAEGRNGYFGANLARGRQDMRNCDVGEVRDGEWTILEPNTEEFLDPARWATTTPLVTDIDGISVHCVGPDAAKCTAFDVDTTYPILNVEEQDVFQRWLKANLFPTMEAMRAAVPPEYPEYLYIAGQLNPGHEVQFLKGAIPSNVPLEVPSTWRQRARVILKNVTHDAPRGLIRQKDLPGFFCYGAAPASCTDQVDGKHYLQAFIE